MRPCYGLAEATLAVTFDCGGEGVRTAPVPAAAHGAGELGEVVSVGVPVPDTEVRITAPDGRALADGTVGEVRVRGPGIFSGYWNDDEATRETLHDGWLRTGDLGFVRSGELYLSGRTKDILIVRGQNLMPHDLEWIVEEVAGGGGACRAGAFSVPRLERRGAGGGGRDRRRRALRSRRAGARDPRPGRHPPRAGPRRRRLRAQG